MATKKTKGKTNAANAEFFEAVRLLEQEKGILAEYLIEKIRTGKLEAGKWYELTIKLDAGGSELFIDGVSRGKLALPECVPTGGLNVMFIVNPGGKGSSLRILTLAFAP